MARDKYAKVRALQSEAVTLELVTWREWYRPWKNRRRWREIGRLHDQAFAELDAIKMRSAEFGAAAVRLREAGQ